MWIHLWDPFSTFKVDIGRWEEVSGRRYISAGIVEYLVWPMECLIEEVLSFTIVLSFIRQPNTPTFIAARVTAVVSHSTCHSTAIKSTWWHSGWLNRIAKCSGSVHTVPKWLCTLCPHSVSKGDYFALFVSSWFLAQKHASRAGSAQHHFFYIWVILGLIFKADRASGACQAIHLCIHYL